MHKNIAYRTTYLGMSGYTWPENTARQSPFKICSLAMPRVDAGIQVMNRLDSQSARPLVDSQATLW